MIRAISLLCLLIVPGVTARAQAPLPIENAALSAEVRPDGSYEIFARGEARPVLVSRVGAEVSHQWLWSSDYPAHEATESSFHDALGAGRSLEVRFHGLSGRPDLVYHLRLYDQRPYGDVAVAVDNSAGKSFTVQSIRVVDASGTPKIDLGGSAAEDRVLAEPFSENPSIHIGTLAQAPDGDYLGVRDELIYNTASKRSLLIAALTADRFLTILHLRTRRDTSGDASISSFTADSTGTTEITRRWDHLSPQQQVELNLPLPPGASIRSERVMFAAGTDYFSQLEAYGNAVRVLHHARTTEAAPMGWWSWTAFYAGITAGDVLTNADWLATHLKSLGYDYFHIDEGYQYARGEYATANATQFPDGMRSIGHAICRHGLTFGIWTGPFEVSSRAWVYEHHPDWLVRDAQGKPIDIGSVDNVDRLYALDTTNPGAQAYLRETYRTLTRQWGVRYIKLDFMDASDIEGYHYKPDTTALEAQRIGLEVIRKAVGNDVLLDKDGSPMLLPVGIVNEGRISLDTGHSFQASKNAGTNIAARFYINRNFYVNDPDAFSVAGQLEPQQVGHEHQAGKPLTLSEAQVQIVLAAVTGGMYEIGDDLPTLGSEPERLALVKNRELIAMNRLGRAALPLDLMTFPAADEQPSVFFLREDRRQAMLAVFNWTEQPRSHVFSLAALRLPAGHPFRAFDVLNGDAPVALESGVLRLDNQPRHSVRLIKLVDNSVPASAPDVSARVPESAKAGEPLEMSARLSSQSVAALSYRWSFGDSTSASGPQVAHTYTKAGTYTVRLRVEGIDGLAADKDFRVAVTGYPNTLFQLKLNRRYQP